MMSELHIKIRSTGILSDLTATQIIAKLVYLQNWRLSGGDEGGPSLAIERKFTFANYYETIAFVNALAFVVHQLDHHPELMVTYNSCTVRLNTHDVKAISQLDFDCAAQIDALLSSEKLAKDTL
jgi:4a-hydroxytetrahydrobiopterin dehydratase